MNKLKLKVASALLPVASVASTGTVFAQDGVQQIPEAPISDVNDIISIVNRIVNIIFTALLIGAVIVIIMAAFDYLSSKGDAAKITAAHQKIIYAAVAIAVALLAKAVEVVVRSFLGVS